MTQNQASAKLPPLRRPSAHLKHFEPRPAASPKEQPVVLERNVLRSQSRGKGDQQTRRQRIVAGDLPAWEPLPPGELFLSRPQP